LPAPLEILGPLVDKPELGVPVRMDGAFLGLLVALEANGMVRPAPSTSPKRAQ
jgi:hypothetical protein